jgi:hypothetical protein
MGPGARRLLPNLLPSLAVAGVVAVIAIGLPAINDQVAAKQPVASNRPYLVGDGVAVTPPSGAGLDATKTRPGETIGTALFLIGSVRYAVVVTPFDGTVSDAAARTRAKIEANAGFQVVGQEQPIRTAAGVSGLQGMYSSPGRDGRFADFVYQGVGAEVTVAGNAVELRTLLPKLSTSIASLTFGNGSG